MRIFKLTDVLYSSIFDNPKRDPLRQPQMFRAHLWGLWGKDSRSPRRKTLHNLDGLIQLSHVHSKGALLTGQKQVGDFKPSA